MESARSVLPGNQRLVFGEEFPHAFFKLVHYFKGPLTASNHQQSANSIITVLSKIRCNAGNITKRGTPPAEPLMTRKPVVQHCGLKH
jgi:hypothetical protein